MRRIRALYRDASLAQVVATWNRLKTEERELFRRARPTRKYVSRFEAYKASFVRRMWNSSEFMRTFKQHFTMSFNGRREHSGTMFEGRCHERNHPAERPTMWRTSAYIDINAWEAGIAERPEDYRWCSFAAAAGGDRKARAGYAFMYGGGGWQVVRGCREKSMREAMSEVLKAREAEKGDCHAGRGAAGGGRHQEPRPFLALLHDAAGGEGACRKNRSRQTDVAKAGVQAGMRCCINKTVSIGSVGNILRVPLKEE